MVRKIKNLTLLRKALGVGGGRRSRYSRGGRRHRRGGNWLSDAWGTVKKGVTNAANATYSGLKTAHDWTKKNKVISKVLGFVPHPVANIAGYAVDKLGYGRRRRVGRPRKHRGGALGGETSLPLAAIMDPVNINNTGRLGRIKTFLQRHKLISRSLKFGSHFHEPLGPWAELAHNLGYGRKKRRVGRGRGRKRGRGIGDLARNLLISSAVKNNKLISGGIGMLRKVHPFLRDNLKFAHKAAVKAGYGRSRLRQIIPPFHSMHGSGYSTNQVARPKF